MERPVAGRERHRVAVATGVDPQAPLDSHGPYTGSIGDHGQRLVRQVETHGLFIGPLGVASRLTDGAPAVTVLPVGVSEDDPGAGSHQAGHPGRVIGERTGEEERSTDLQEPLPGGGHDALGVTGHQDRPGRISGSEDGRRVGHRHDHHRDRMFGVHGPAEGVLVEEGSLRSGHVGHRLAEPDRRSEAGRIAYHGPQVDRTGRPEPFELQVGTQHHVADAHEAGQWRQGVRVEATLLDLGVQGHQECRRCRRSLRDELARHVRTIHEPREHRVSRVAPPVGGEVAARDLQYPGSCSPGVEMVGRVVPGRWYLLRSLDEGPQHLALPQRRQVGHYQEARKDGQGPLQPGPPTSHGDHPGTHADSQPQY